jgi:hypothetical protein
MPQAMEYLKTVKRLASGWEKKRKSPPLAAHLEHPPSPFRREFQQKNVRRDCAGWHVSFLIFCLCKNMSF